MQEQNKEITAIVQWLRQNTESRADLKLDSRDIQPGDVFVASKGQQSDGAKYIPAAIDKGAAAILVDAASEHATDALRQASMQVPVLAVEGLRALLGMLADEWYGRPSEAVKVIAITGTNGKTSCASWVAQALNLNNTACATIGTLGVVLPNGKNLGGYLTTPDVLSLHRMLAYLRDQGIFTVAMEASSIGLEQGRMDGIRIAIAGFTNLSLDHLDYHHSMEEYEAAKALLFAWPGLKLAVLNGDDEAGIRLAKKSVATKTLTYSLDMNSRADIRALHYTFHDYGLSFMLHTDNGDTQVLSRLVGEHNISNLLLTVGILEGLGWGLSRISRTLSNLEAVAGRLETVEPLLNPQNKPLVVVDYAHSPDALKRALQALRPNAEARKGRLICVFGCGGDRDRSKRPIMAQIAEELADLVYITSDNPRTEDPEQILAEIVAGISSFDSERLALVEKNRDYSILYSILRAKPEDVVLIAGKGHEDYQEIHGVRHYFDDRQWAALGLLMRDGLSVCSDTRQLERGQFFVALKGENFDAHSLLEQAEKKKAMAALVSERNAKLNLVQVQVHNTQDALMTMSKAWRALFDLPVIAVTGSNGKTTTKEMIASVLEAAHGEDYIATLGNLNNHIGVPLSLLRLRANHKIAVFELGMNHPGEIEVLADLCRPTVAVLTNAQREHQEFMQTVDAVAQENASVFAYLTAEGVAVYPAATEYTPLWDELSSAAESLRFAIDEDVAEVYGTELESYTEGIRFVLNANNTQTAIDLQIPGEHNVSNALAASGACLAAGLGLADIKQGLESFAPVSGRLQNYVLKNGTRVIDDSYNANPDSVRAAIDVLSALPGPTLLVLGDMGEVGPEGPQMHREVGEYAKQQGINHLLTFGEASQQSSQAFGAGAQHFKEIETLFKTVALLGPAAILVKGSRSMRMERVVQDLLSKQGK
ncbi:MAG: bifunctional UDP-N-acetylmuramoyl-L-alanyl-D-glutamate--2,6-diaminopimelate ligase MurE/UDP-N-acetylmuramoyl-tripeptide--D-alanyl-D-alanine ligase MurF [Alcaligenaceae bacterium]|nr:bifunctional UDP-N-acetylmuramoyl-L-alanyl-D-glutamate--2,6-diaminopimelate ligase MurE/UDP-N-acetylmuramoyl-tripeptide--D-alanyl-D-alanine ligase MurF [Alcaligenaceae bacterium]